MARRAIYVPGLGHATHPIPSAARVGPLLVSGGVSGVDRTTGAIPSAAADQVDNVLDNAIAVAREAGGSADDIVKFVFYVADRAIRQALNPGWERRFPDPARRPARHVLVYDALPAGMLLQCEITAWIAGPAGGDRDEEGEE